MRAASVTCTVGGIWMAPIRPGEPILFPLSGQRPGLHQRTDCLLHKKWVAPFDQQLLERVKTAILAEQRIQQVSGTLRGQRVQAELTVVGFARPAVLVLWPVVHEEQQPGGTKALD